MSRDAPPNPYATPQAETAAAVVRSGDTAFQQTRKIFIQWERLRIPYNAVLVLFTAVMLARILHEGRRESA